MKPFTRRLAAAKKASGLTIKEMAVWFDNMSDQTMWSWLQGRIPKPYHADSAERNLVLLEKEISKRRSGLPLPMSVRQGERQVHVARIRKRYV